MNNVSLSRERILRMTPEFRRMLPRHVDADKFARVVMTSLQRQPDLRSADEASFFEACLLCAQDGLLPDGREAALVVYTTRARGPAGDQWVKKVQYIPMIAGLRKKAMQSGVVRDWIARVVRERDKFRIIYGDRDSIEHEPAIVDPGEMIAAYSKATLPDGSISYEVMLAEEIAAVRSAVKRRNNTQDVWSEHPGEMWRKTVMRRHAKSFLMPADLSAVVERIDQLYQVDIAEDRGDAHQRLDAAPRIPSAPVITSDAQTAPSETSDDGPDWVQAGRDACRSGIKYTTPPGELREPDMREALEDWRRGWREELESGRKGAST